MANLPLEGIRIADWTIMNAGPQVAAWMSAFGAEAIHIERRDIGDFHRQVRRGQSTAPRCVGNTSRPALFEYSNFNKKSITVDLSKEKGRELVYRLIGNSDVFVTNQLPDVVEKWAMDYETVSKYNPRIIYGVNTVMGPKGPRRLTPGWDEIGQAVSGMMATSTPTGHPPLQATIGLSDMASAFSLMCGIITALLHRERTGKGQMVEVSQLQACMNMLAGPILGVYLMASEEQRRADPRGGVMKGASREDPQQPTALPYRCKDGRWIIAGVLTDKHKKSLSEVIERPELVDDPRFAAGEKMIENRIELIKILDEVFATKTFDEWSEKFKGADVAFTPINNLPDLPSDPQVIANNYLTTIDIPECGPLPFPGMPFTLSETPGTVRTPAPELGAHNYEILSEICSYSPEEIAKLYAEEVI
jgi:formyl-CoA transferase